MKKEKILLALLPYWSPLIPPIGAACLKGALKADGFDVKLVDANVEMDFSELYDRYFEILKRNVPEEKQGNFLSVGHDVMRHQMTAFLHRPEDDPENDRYFRLVDILVDRTFFTEIPRSEVLKLHGLVETFFQRLRTYVLDLVERENPTVLGLSVFSGTLPASLFAFRLVRERYPHIRTVMGGGVFADQLAVDTPNFERFLEITVPYIDKIIVGEGEPLMLKWLKGELPESQRVYTFRDINGEIMDPATATLPDMTDFDTGHYPYIVSYASRSCPYQCSFCSETIQWGRYRKKPVEKVRGELEELYKRHGSQLFLLSDSLLNPVIRSLAEEMARSDVSLYWGGWLRVDRHCADPGRVMEWRRGGFYHARLGIESGSPRVLELMGKDITPDQVRDSVTTLAAAGIKTTTLWVVGHPGETEADFQTTLDLIEELRNDIYEAECRPFYYYLTGQSASDSDWWSKTGKIPLYPEEMEDMLLFRTLMLDCEPRREESYRRMNRFVAHCRKLGIPNPYSMQDIYDADRRWQKLHKNAVPPVVAFKDGGPPIEENKHVKKVNLVAPPRNGQ